MWIPVLLVVGVASAGVLVAFPTIVARETPPPLMGRVSATTSAVPTVFQVAAPLAGAAVAHWLGLGAVFVGAGIGLAVLGLVVVFLRPSVGAGVNPARSATPIEPEVAGFVDPPLERRELFATNRHCLAPARSAGGKA